MDWRISGWAFVLALFIGCGGEYMHLHLFIDLTIATTNVQAHQSTGQAQCHWPATCRHEPPRNIKC